MKWTDFPLLFSSSLCPRIIFFCIINSKLYSDETKQQEKTCTNILKNISHFHNKIKKYGKNNKEEHLLSVTFLSIIIRQNLKFPGLTDWPDCRLTTMKEERKTQHSGKPFAFTSWQDVNFQSQNFPRQSDHQCAETG